MIKEVTGFVVGTVDYGDSSLIINVLTKEYGLIGMMAKGAKGMKSPLRAVCQKFTYGLFYVYYKENKLSIVKDVDVINPFNHLHEDILLIGYLNYVTELVTQVYKESENETLFDLLIATLEKMNASFDPLCLTNILEVKCLSFLGVGLSLDECSLCGSKMNIVTIDGASGGLICKNCYTNERIVSLKSIKLLRSFLYIDIKKIEKLNIKEENKREINTFLTTYYEQYTGIYLKSKNFIEKLTQF